MSAVLRLRSPSSLEPVKSSKASRISASWSAVMLCSLASFERRFAGTLGVEAAAALRLGGWRC